MREFSAPESYDVPATGNLTDAIVANAHEYADQVALRRRGPDGRWVDVPWREFLADVTSLAKGLIGAGVQAGDRIGLMSKTRYEWVVADYATWFAGATTVPIYETSSSDQVAWILADSGAVLVFVETRDHVERVGKARADAAQLRHVVCFDTGDLDALRARGAGVRADRLEARRTESTPQTLATLIYTSGTTGRPKGCMLTHGNFMFEIAVDVQGLDRLFVNAEAGTLLFLPLAHVFARVIAIACLQRRALLGLSADVNHLVDDFGTFRPTFILGVPRVFEKVFNAASQRATADGHGRLFDAAAATAIAFSEALERGGPGLLLRARHALFDRLVYRRLRASLGGRAEWVISGGAPLGERLAHFFRGAGVPVLEGYGLTETTAAVTVNTPEFQRIGTVGRPLAGTSVKVADDGELLFRGGQVFTGYWQNDEATAEVFEDGWFRTGDVGEVDDDGYVRITGRKKEIIVTAGGKNVAPAVLEDRLRAHPLVSQCLVVGDGKPFVAALVTLDPEALADWVKSHDKTGSIADLASDPDLLAAIQHGVDDANSAVSRAEGIRKFKVLSIDWTEESGEVTPTLKLKRNLVLATYHDDIESLYR
ncbi:MAG TPA: long-chain fatty acid--CoA ligase [Nocardioidaceae bacterium]|nr:long-chain fatty acid--CoA ligase [Nocardioidaceae bacterium]